MMKKLFSVVFILLLLVFPMALHNHDKGNKEAVNTVSDIDDITLKESRVEGREYGETRAVVHREEDEYGGSWFDEFTDESGVEWKENVSVGDGTIELIPSGTLTSGFGIDGVVENNPSGGGDTALSIAIDSNYIYIAGYDYSPGKAQWRIEKRDVKTGALVNTFDGDGVVESNPSEDHEGACSIAINSSFIYVAGYDCSPGNAQWRIEKRDIITGSLVGAFNGDGVVESNPSDGGDAIYSIAIDSSYIYVAGYDNSPGNLQWRIEKRDINTGALVNAFDGDGVVEVNPSGSQEIANCIALDSNYIYVVGQSYSGNAQWRIEKRDINTGALVNAFDNDGIVESNPGGVGGSAYSIAIDSSYIYITGGDESPGDRQWRIEKRDINNGTLGCAE